MKVSYSEQTIAWKIVFKFTTFIKILEIFKNIITVITWSIQILNL